jgi:threonine synthase
MVDFVTGLRCRECRRPFPAEALHVCDYCFGPLEVAYDYERIAATITRERIARGPRSIWRYKDLLPVDDESPVDLGAGFTPLVRADRLAAELGLGELWIKDDTANPTGSFKDRVVSVALTKARQLGFKVAACASTGNLANSVAAHAARAGMDSVVLIPHDLEAAKVTMTTIYGGTVIAVEGTYDDVNRLCAELTSERPSWAFVNVNVRTYYAEGSKTLAFEIAEQLGWQAPDHVVVPIGSGSQLTKVAKGFAELGQVGLLDEVPQVRISGAQAEGCSPVATAFLEGSDAIRPVKPKTIAKSLAIGNPADGWYALDTMRKSGGSCAAVTDGEVVEAIGLLARTEGIFAETAGGVSNATQAKLAAPGAIHRYHHPDAGCLRRGHQLRGEPMSLTVRIPTQLRTLTGGAGEVEVEGGTVGEALKALDAAHPGLAERLFDDAGGLRRFVNVFLADEDVRFLDGLATPITPGQTLSIVPAVAGG